MTPEIHHLKKLLSYAQAELDRLEKLEPHLPAEWINHDGRVMPATLRDEQIVEIMFAGIGQAHRRGQAQSYEWEWDKVSRDQWQILAYRCVG